MKRKSEAEVDATQVKFAKTLSADDLDSKRIKIFKHARHFSKDGKFHEMYWDEDGKGKLKVVKGEVPKEDPADQMEIAAPEIEWVDVDDVAKQVEERAAKLLAGGFEEMEDFVNIHKLHVPCFMWSLADEGPSEKEPITSSRIGGAPAMYKDEAWPASTKFAFQVDLSTVPKRMQEIVGKTGLLQLFFNPGGDEWFEKVHTFRIIPETDFDKLEARDRSNNNDEEEQEEEEEEEAYGPKKARAIKGWVEHADYPGPEYEGDVEVDLEQVGTLRQTLSKFGGYSILTQSEGEIEHKACEKCGETHMQSRAAFNLADGGVLNFLLGDGGTGQFMYCPNATTWNYDYDAACS